MDRPATHRFRSNALRWLPQLATQALVRDPFPDVAIAAVDPADLGPAAITVLQGGHDGEYDDSLIDPTLPTLLVRPAGTLSQLGRGSCGPIPLTAALDHLNRPPLRAIRVAS